MKKQFPYLAILFTAFVTGFFGKPTEAIAQAYDFTYPDTLKISATNQQNHGFTFHLYENCSSVPASFSNLPVSYTLNGLPPLPNEILCCFPVLGMGNPFCPAVPVTCLSGGLLNYQKSGVTYMFTTKANVAAPGFYSFQTRFGFGGIGNFEAANIVGTFALEPETFNGFATGMNNVAPRFVNPPVIFAPVHDQVRFFAGAIDPDGDSLVYRLRSAGLNATYASGLSANLPIWTQAGIFDLNATTGVLSFIPIAYNQTAGPGAKANNYVIGINVDEYRKINGVVTKIGTIQRNVLVNVIQSTTNNKPTLASTYQNAVLYPDTIIEVIAGTPVTLNFTSSDPDAADVVSLSSNIASFLPGAVFTSSIPNSGTGQISWTPTNADVRKQPYSFHVTAKDDFCPYPGSATNSYGIRVKSVTGISADNFKPNLFSVYPNPASQEVNFKIDTKKGVQEILIYNILGQQIDQIELPKHKSNSQELRWKNAEKFAAGTYLAKLLATDKTTQTIRFIKQ